MASMNWLGFSLSAQELPPQPSNPHHHGYNSDEISGGNDVSAGECFDLTSDSTAPNSLNLPAPFGGILEAFNRNNSHHSQDWNMKSLGMNSSETNYNKTNSSDFSMLMSSTNSTNTNQTLENHHHQQQPKLENFLGRHSFADHDHHHHHHGYAAEYMYPASACSSMHVPSDVAAASDGGAMSNSASNGNGSSIGLSMIKTWLRNQPPNHQEGKNDVGAATAAHGAGGGNSNGLSGVHVAVSSGTNAAQSALSLSMSTGSQSSSALPLLSAAAAASGGESSSSDNNKQQQQQTRAVAATAIDSQTGAIEAVPRKSIDTFGQRTSIYRGVTRHRWTGRYEAHLWDNSCRREGQTRKGRQVYLGGYDKEEKAARAYDLAALKYWGTTTTTNFPISNYEKELEEMKHMTRQEYVASLRRKSSGFSRGASIYRGVTRHHQHGRWQARIGRVAGNKDLYLGTFSTQEEAAEAYDIAAIKFRGLNAVTNFDMSRYDVKSILESSTLPIGGAAKRLKDAEAAQAADQIAAVAAAAAAAAAAHTDIDDGMSSQLSDAISSAYAGAGAAAASWPTLAFNQPAAGAALAMHYPNYGASRVWCKQEVQDSDHHQSFQYHDLHHQLQLSNTHNFFQPASVLHNLMGIDDQHSSGSNSVMYSNVTTGDTSYVIPMATVIASDHQQGSNNNNNGGFSTHHHQHQHHSTNNSATTSTTSNTHDHVFGTSSTDMAYHRSLYNYMSQQQPQLGSACNSWVPTAVPTITAAGPGAPRSSSIAAVCHGTTPTFTVWNDA